MQQAGTPPFDKVILVCVNERDPAEGSCCSARSSVEIARAIKDAVKKGNWRVRVRVTRSYCLGQCELGPNVVVLPENAWYHGVRPADVPTILQRHLG